MTQPEIWGSGSSLFLCFLFMLPMPSPVQSREVIWPIWPLKCRHGTVFSCFNFSFATPIVSAPQSLGAIWVIWPLMLALRHWTVFIFRFSFALPTPHPRSKPVCDPGKLAAPVAARDRVLMF